MSDKREKFVAKKQEWAAQGRLLTGHAGDPVRDRLPPGQTLTHGFPVLDLGEQPAIGEQAFRLEIGGAVRRPVTLDWTAYVALPQTDDVSDIHCVTQWSRYDNAWRGVSTSALLDLVEPKDEARHVLFLSHDGYATNVRLDQFAAPDAMLAHLWDGKPLSRDHGGPVRVVIPKLYLWKSPKWIKRIEFSAVDQPGFWETRGYNNNADPWVEERYS